MTRPRVLVLQDYFLPGFEGGGSLRSVANIVEVLSDEFDFRIITRDRDRNDDAPYPSIEPGWNRRADCSVLYLDRRTINPIGMWRVLRRLDYDLVYCNSFFSTLTVLVLLLRRLGLLRERPVLVAPSGEFARAALALRALKKSVYLFAARTAGLPRSITWHASTELEREEIQRLLPGKVLIARDLPTPWQGIEGSLATIPEKSSGSLRLVFISRITPKKNLHRAIEFVSQLEGDVVFDIFGPPEDVIYLGRCLRLIAELPEGIRCSYLGSVPYAEVSATISQYHFLLLPTLNENFGHVILEALVVGLPLIISDKTPWRNLESLGVGFDVSLEGDGAFGRQLEKCLAMGSAEHRELSRGAAEVGARELHDGRVVAANRELFRSALAAGTGERPPSGSGASDVECSNEIGARRAD